MSNFEEIVNNMRSHGLKLPVERVNISVPDAKNVLIKAMTFFLNKQGKTLVWLQQYDEIADWLTDNNGKGLLLFGSCGTGKTFIARYAITAILLHYCNKVVTSFDMAEVNADPDKVLTKHIISLDDIGTEEISIKFGERRSIIPEILDSAEKYGKLVIMTSNLGATELIAKYGNRTFDRIIATTKRIEFNGKSFRE